MADNRQFTDHNSIGNVNVYYKDRQLKERTAVSNAASIANLKFLLTTGDDEGFRTAIKSYIDEAIRSALGALVDNLDKGTGVSRILGTDASHDLGTITPANLASVLGVYAKYFESSNPDAPTSFYGGVFIQIGEKNGLQFCYDYDTLWCRMVLNGSTYQDWKPIQFKQ